MTRQYNAKHLKEDLQKSGNVKSVRIKDDYEDLKLNLIRQTLNVELTEKGYGFDLLYEKYPTLRVEDIYTTSEGTIKTTMTVKEIVE